MIFDKTLMFSDAQAITGDAPSTNVIDLGVTGTVYGAAAALSRDIGKGKKIPLLIQVVEDFDELTSLTIDVQASSVENFGTAKTVASQTIALAGLVAGATCSIDCVLPGVDLRYMRLNYNVNGTDPANGAITAGIVGAVQSNGVDF